MTAGMAHHLVSRAIDVTQQHYNNGNDGAKPLNMLQQWAIVAVLVTVVLYVATLSIVSRLSSNTLQSQQTARLILALNF